MKCPTCNGTGEVHDEIETIATENQDPIIGHLNKEWGLKGFKPALPGHPVYDDGNRYVINLEPQMSGDTIRVTFYKETLKSWIDFS